MDTTSSKTKHWFFDDIMAMERFPRMHLMNTISGIKGVQLLGTMSHKGTPNLGVFSSIVHIGANPPHLGFILRPLSVPRHSYHNIKAKGYFTLNSIHPSFLPQAHQSSANYGVETSEFEAVGLTPFYTNTHPAPYVAESPIKLGLEWVEEHHIQANGTLFIVGKVVEVLFPESAMAPSGHILHDQIETMAVSGLDTYYELGEKHQLAYARVPKS